MADDSRRKIITIIILAATSPGLFTGCYNGVMTWQTLSPLPQIQLQSTLTTPTTTGTVNQLLDPAPIVQIVDSSGKLLTSGIYNITLTAYSDPACSSNPSTSALSTVASDLGVAIFPNITASQFAGTYYYQASGPGLLTSACSAGISIVAGTADHLATVFPNSTNGTSSTTYSVSSGTAFTAKIQAMDAYGNATGVGSPLNVALSDLSGGSLSTGVNHVSTDNSGLATFIIQPTFPTSSASPVVSALPPTYVLKATATNLTNQPSVAVPVTETPAAISKFAINNLPPAFMTNDAQWMQLIALDSSNHIVTSFAGTVTFAVNGLTATQWTMSESDLGAIWVSPIGISTLGGVEETLVATVTTGNLTPTSLPSSTVFNSNGNTRSTACMTAQGVFNSGASNGGDWGTPGNWNPGLSVPPSALLSANLDCTVSSTFYPECLQIEAGTLTISKTATITPEINVAVSSNPPPSIFNMTGGTIELAGNTAAGNLSLGYAAGLGSIFNMTGGTISIGTNGNLALGSGEPFTRVQISGTASITAFTGSTTTPTIYLNGGLMQVVANPSRNNIALPTLSATGSGHVNDTLLFTGGEMTVNSLSFNASSNSYPVYINNAITVTGAIVIPSNVSIIINPGGQLTASGGITVNSGGTLRVAAGGSLLIDTAGSGVGLEVDGTLQLAGTAASPAVIGGLNSTTALPFVIDTPGTINATYFTVRNLNSDGIKLKACTIQQFSQGTFKNIPSGGYGVTFVGYETLTNPFAISNLSFDLSVSGSLAINAASAGSSVLPIIGATYSTASVTNGTLSYRSNTALGGAFVSDNSSAHLVWVR